MQNISSLSSYTNYLPVDVNAQLVQALAQKDMDTIKFLVETKGALLTVQDANGNLPLHVAVIVGFFPAVSYLLDRGADPKAPNQAGKTALQLAQEANNQTLVLMLTRDTTPPAETATPVAYKKEEVALRNGVLESTPEEDAFSTHHLLLKGAADERGGELGTKLSGLIKQLKQPWMMLQEQPEPGVWARWFGPGLHPFNRADFSAKSTFLKPLSDRLIRIKSLQTELQPLNRKNNRAIADHLTAITRIYEAFIVQLSQAAPPARHKLMEGRVQVRGADLGCRFLSAESVQKLFHGEKGNEFGQHRVAILHGVHWKENPYAPGIEKAVDSLNKLVSGQGSPPTLLTKIIHQGQSSAFLASKTVTGPNLQKVLWEESQKIEKIVPGNFSAMVALGILVDPIDGKPDNFILADGPTPGTHLLVSIDNDMAFSSGVYQYYSKLAKEQQHMIDVMYTPFCFSQMNEPVDRGFREAFSKLCPEEVILRWLRGINDQNGAYKTLREQKVFSTEEYERLQLPIALSPSLPNEPGLVELLYSKLKAMQKVLKEGKEITHWELFYAAHPIVARYYKSRIDEYRAKEKEPTTQGAFMHLFGGGGPCVEQAVNMKSVVKSKLTVKSALAKNQKVVGQQELYRIQSPKRALEAFIANLPWKELSFDVQDRLLNELFIVPYLRKIVLKNAEGVTDRHLMRLADHTVKLEELDLTRCPQITVAGVSALLARKPHLKITVCESMKLARKEYLFLAQSSEKFSIRLGTEEVVSFSNIKHGLAQAIHAQNEEVFFALLEAGGAVNEKDEQGYTPLHCAVGIADREPEKAKKMIIALVLAGASLEEKDAAGETAMARAERKDLQEVVELFEKLKQPLAFLEAENPQRFGQLPKLWLVGRGGVTKEKLQGLCEKWGVKEVFGNVQQWEMLNGPLNMEEQLWLQQGGVLGVAKVKLEGLKAMPAMAFGVEEWSKYYGEVGAEPPLPADIYTVLTGPCPFWPGKKVHETHLLVLIPKKVNGQPFTLDSLEEMIKEPKQGHPTKYAEYSAKRERGNKTVSRGYWVLMTRDVLLGSRNKPYSEQKQQVEGYRGYEVPKLLEAATCVLMEHVRTGKRLYGDNPSTYTRCQEQVLDYQGVIGGFSSGGLGINHHHLAVDIYGVGAVRKFLEPGRLMERNNEERGE